MTNFRPLFTNWDTQLLKAAVHIWTKACNSHSSWNRVIKHTSIYADLSKVSLYTHKAAASTLKNSLKRRLKELFCSRMTCILSDFFQAPAEQLRSNFGQTVDENHHCTVVYFWYTKRQKKHNTMKSWPATVTIEVTKLGGHS